MIVVCGVMAVMTTCITINIVAQTENNYYYLEDAFPACLRFFAWMKVLGFTDGNGRPVLSLSLLSWRMIIWGTKNHSTFAVMKGVDVLILPPPFLLPWKIDTTYRVAASLMIAKPSSSDNNIMLCIQLSFSGVQFVVGRPRDQVATLFFWFITSRVVIGRMFMTVPYNRLCTHSANCFRFHFI